MHVVIQTLFIVGHSMMLNNCTSASYDCNQKTSHGVLQVDSLALVPPFQQCQGPKTLTFHGVPGHTAYYRI